MATADEVTQKKEEPQKKKSKESFWHYKRFFYQLLINVVVTTILLGGIIAWLFHFDPEIEKFIFPSLKQIEAMKKEITILTVKIEGLERQIQSHKEQLFEVRNLRSQVTTFGETLNTFSHSLKELTEQLEKFKHPTLQGQTDFLKEGLNQLQQHIDKGEAFSEVLHTLISKVGSDKLTIDAINQLRVYAHAPTKTSSMLTQELQTIYDQLKARKAEKESVTLENKGLWRRFVSKVYNLVHIEKIGEAERKQEVNQLDLINVLAKIEEIIKNLNQQNLAYAVESARILAGQYKGLFSSWLQEAERRKNLEEAFSLFRKRIETLIKRNV